MQHYAWGPAQHSRVAPIAARIPSSDTRERGPRANAECGNLDMHFVFFAGFEPLFIENTMEKITTL